MTTSRRPRWQAPFRFLRFAVHTVHDPHFAPQLKSYLLIMAIGWSVGAAFGFLVGLVQAFSAPASSGQPVPAPLLRSGEHV